MKREHVLSVIRKAKEEPAEFLNLIKKHVGVHRKQSVYTQTLHFTFLLYRKIQPTNLISPSFCKLYPRRNMLAYGELLSFSQKSVPEAWKVQSLPLRKLHPLLTSR